jgi:hypothetical protein
MAENDEGKPDLKLMCVCAHCNEHKSDGICVELNFREMAIFYMCLACKKMNKLELKSSANRPYPRSGIMR